MEYVSLWILLNTYCGLVMLCTLTTFDISPLLYSLISGHKWWILYPFNVVEDPMVLCDPTCSTVEKPEALEWYLSIGKDAARTSWADNATPMHVLQKPGETLYVPNGYHHSVLNLDETVAITANFGSPGNLQVVWEQAVRKGSEEQYVNMFNDVFNDEQREQVEDGEIWPPEEYAGVVIDGGDFYGSDNEDDEEEEYVYVRQDEL